MWAWISIAAVIVALAVLAITRRAELRPRGFVLLAVALLLAVGAETLIQTDTVSVGRGSELLGIALILVAAWAIWKLPGADRRSPRR